MSEAGRFAGEIANWRRLMATVPADARVAVFTNAASEIASYVPKGLDKRAAVDELADIASAHGLDDTDTVQQIIADAFVEIEQLRFDAGGFNVVQLPPPTKRTNGHAKAREVVVAPTPYLLPDAATLPPRGWLSFRHYMRGIVTSTVAPGGYGKTSLAIYEALEMVKRGVCVWYVSAEDDRAELDRRIAAYVKRHTVTSTELAQKFFVDDKLSFPFKIARSGRNAVVFDDAKLDAFEAAIALNRIDVVFFDPFISFHYLPENDTAAMDALVKRLGDICSRQQCCIELPHHVRKRAFGQGEITVDDARGAGAIVNAVRSCRVINVMSTTEAEQAQIERAKRMFYLRIDSGKSNMAPPEKARWLHLASVEIANGDHVGVIEPWEFPKVFDRISIADVAWVRELVRFRIYRADSRSPDWLGHELAQRFGRNVTNVGDVKWINAVLTTWVHNGVIGKERRPDKDRKERLCFVPVAAPPDGSEKPSLPLADEDSDSD